MVTRRGNEDILGRGTMLIALTDMGLAAIAIIACTFSIVDIEGNWTPKVSILTVQRLDDQVMHLGKFYFIAEILYFLFGVILLIGAKTGRPCLVYTWYIPNLIGIILLFCVCMVLAFTRIHLIVIYLPGLICFRAFQTWIVREFHWALHDNRY